jgi:hypothetical protein
MKHLARWGATPSDQSLQKITLLRFKFYLRAGTSCSWHSETLLSSQQNNKLLM